MHVFIQYVIEWSDITIPIEPPPRFNDQFELPIYLFQSIYEISTMKLKLYIGKLHQWEQSKKGEPLSLAHVYKYLRIFNGIHIHNVLYCNYWS